MPVVAQTQDQVETGEATTQIPPVAQNDSNGYNKAREEPGPEEPGHITTEHGFTGTVGIKEDGYATQLSFSFLPVRGLWCTGLRQ